MLNDTAPEARRAQIALLRRASTAERAALACSLSATTLALARRAIRRSMPGADDQAILVAVVTNHYGSELGERLRAYFAAR